MKRTMITICLIPVIAFGALSEACAAQSENAPCSNCDEGHCLLLSGNYVGAVRCLRTCAAIGHVYAQAELGDCYYYPGQGVERNIREAAKWYLKAAQQGHMHSIFMTGFLLYTGDGVEQNRSEAVRWLRKSADQGVPDACFLLASCYLSGLGIDRDDEQFIFWLRKAAKFGDDKKEAEAFISLTWLLYRMKIDAEFVPLAQFLLGQLYENGSALPKDLNEAEKWYQKAAAWGYKEAKDALVRLRTGEKKIQTAAKTSERVKMRPIIADVATMSDGTSVNAPFEKMTRTFEAIVEQHEQIRKMFESTPSRAKVQKPKVTLTLPGGATIEMIYCPPGEFLMGSDEYGPVHRVKITKGFWLSKYEVTQAQWKSVMGENPSSFSGNGTLPVESIYWRQAVSFCEKIDSSLRCGARLPTEAEWEYACRAGTRTDFNIGNDIIVGDANCRMEFKWPIEPKKTQPVGRFKPNRWGFYDMHGNVMEWCSDEWDYNYYKKSPLEDPQGLKAGSQDHVLRGGSFDCMKSECSSACRSINGTMRKNRSNFGMRLCCDKIP